MRPQRSLKGLQKQTVITLFKATGQANSARRTFRSCYHNNMSAIEQSTRIIDTLSPRPLQPRKPNLNHEASTGLNHNKDVSSKTNLPSGDANYKSLQKTSNSNWQKEPTIHVPEPKIWKHGPERVLSKSPSMSSLSVRKARHKESALSRLSFESSSLRSRQGRTYTPSIVQTCKENAKPSSGFTDSCIRHSAEDRLPQSRESTCSSLSTRSRPKKRRIISRIFGLPPKNDESAKKHEYSNRALVCKDSEEGLAWKPLTDETL